MTLSTPYTRWAGDDDHGRHPLLTRAWVRLDALYVRPADEPSRVVPDGLDLSGQVPALVSGWFRCVHGTWLGVTNFEIPYADGRKQGVWLVDQLVPGHALRRRDD